MALSSWSPFGVIGSIAIDSIAYGSRVTVGEHDEINCHSRLDRDPYISKNPT